MRSRYLLPPKMMIFSVVYMVITLCFHINAHAEQAQYKGKQFKQVMNDLCDKQIVFLGESSLHGESKVWEFKTALLEQLTTQCGFNTVLFESGIYDFVHLASSIEQGSAKPQMLENAIGGLWTGTPSTQKLIAMLYDKVLNKQIKLGGIDDQISASAKYMKNALPEQLSAYLGQADSLACKTKLLNYANWRYVNGNTFDKTERNSIVACLTDIQNAIAETQGTNIVPINKQHAAIVQSLTRFFSRQFVRQNAYQKRDESMFANFMYHFDTLSNSPLDQPIGDARAITPKIIIWGSSIHGTKQLSHKAPAGGDSSLAPKLMGYYLHSRFGERYASVAFSAVSGTYSSVPTRKKVQTLESPLKGSIEALSMDSTNEFTYYNFNQLAALGTINARALNNQFEQADWSSMFDAMVVLKEEKAPVFK